jgi:hypothetical protein
LELEEKAMATDDKIQVSRNEGSVLGTRRLWSRGFQVSKISGPWFGTWKKKARKEEEEGMAGRTTRAAICLCVCHRHSRIAAKATAVGGRARCHGLLYIQCGCVMQFGAKWCAQQARRGCTEHDGQAKPAWATRTRPTRAPHASNTWQMWLEWRSHGLPTSNTKGIICSCTSPANFLPR